jgi:hypothetical protein
MKTLSTTFQVKKIFAILSLPILASGISYGFGGESPANAAGTIPQATVAKLGTCAWQLAGVSPTVTLTAPTAYSGTGLQLTGTDATANLFVSGDGTQGTNCTWFGGTPAGATITTSIGNSAGFVSSPAAGLDYTFIAGASALTYTPSSVGCPTGIGTSYTALAMYGNAPANNSKATVVISKTGSVIGTSTSCLFSPTYTSLIPAGLTPTGTNNLSAPSITTTLSIQ